WHLAHGIVTIPKSVTPSRIVENLEAADVKLTAEEVAAIDALDRPDGRGGFDPAQRRDGRGTGLCSTASTDPPRAPSSAKCGVSGRIATTSQSSMLAPAAGAPSSMPAPGRPGHGAAPRARCGWAPQ